FSDVDFEVKEGDHIAQLICEKISKVGDTGPLQPLSAQVPPGTRHDHRPRTRDVTITLARSRPSTSRISRCCRSVGRSFPSRR
ncbi:hypothetical protein PFISCL1PPCAC_5260, partial [Pristionchus fissidentatus]